MAKVYSDDYADSGMLAFFLPNKESEYLYSVTQTLPDDYKIISPQDMHVTLAYFDKEFINEYGLDRIHEATVKACNRKPIKVKMCGVNKFDNEDKTIYLQVDSEELKEFRQDLINDLLDDGIRYVDNYPEYTPHVTLAYTKQDALPKLELNPLEIELNPVVLVSGDRGRCLFLSDDAKKTEEKAGRRINTTKLESVHNLSELLTQVQEELMRFLKWGNYDEEQKAERKTIPQLITEARERSNSNTTPSGALRSGSVSPNWSARVGEVIIGNLARGAGGKFISAENVGAIVKILATNNISPGMMQALNDLMSGKQVQDKEILRNLQDANLVGITDGQPVISGFGNDLVNAIKTGDPDKVKELFAKPKAGTSRGSGRGTTTKPGKQELIQQNIESIKDKIIATGRITKEQFNATIDFGAGKPIDNTILEKLLPLGLIEKDVDGNFKTTVPGIRFLDSVGKADLRSSLDALSDGRELYYKSLLDLGTPPEEVTDMRLTDTINTIGGLSSALTKREMENFVEFVNGVTDLSNPSAFVALGLLTNNNELTASGKTFLNALKSGDILKVLDMLKYEWETKETLFGFKTFEDADGETWLLTWTTNSFEDREGEFFTLQAIKEYVDRHIDDDVKGEYWFWHVPEFKFGTIKAQIVAGNNLVEMGTFDDTELGKMFKEYFTKYPEGDKEIAPFGWGNSHGYVYLPEDRKDKVYDWFEKRETSVLPLDQAANPYTLTEFMGVKMGNKAVEAFKKIGEKLGMVDLAEKIIATGNARTEILEKAGVARKAAIMKTEGGYEYPASCYAYVPDSEMSSTWKLRLCAPESTEVTREQLGAAAAAFNPGGFRGNRVELPREDVAKVKARIRSEYEKLDVKPAEMPASVKSFNVKALSGELRDLSASVQDEELKAQMSSAADEMLKAENFATDMAVALVKLAENMSEELAATVLDIAERLQSEDMPETEDVMDEEEQIEVVAEDEPMSEEETPSEKMEDEEMDKTKMEEMKKEIYQELDIDGLEKVIAEQKSANESAMTEIAGLKSALSEYTQKFVDVFDKLATLEKQLIELQKEDETKLAGKALSVPRWGQYRAKEAAQTVLSAEDVKQYRKPEVPNVIANLTKQILK